MPRKQPIIPEQTASSGSDSDVAFHSSYPPAPLRRSKTQNERHELEGDNSSSELSISSDDEDKAPPRRQRKTPIRRVKNQPRKSTARPQLDVELGLSKHHHDQEQMPLCVKIQYVLLPLVIVGIIVVVLVFV
ncbi:hypothetical protein T439DRAFT_356885 [Meredithblackwellia eburnea MCA 4105]